MTVFSYDRDSTIQKQIAKNNEGRIYNREWHMTHAIKNKIKLRGE